jgi:hypothetical protein
MYKGFPRHRTIICAYIILMEPIRASLVTRELEEIHMRENLFSPTINHYTTEHYLQLMVCR